MRLLASMFVALILSLQTKVFTEGFNRPSELADLYKQTACLKWCPSGRECVIKRGEEMCVCHKKCPPRIKRVCGSDGQLYENHCELHRTACVTKKKIKIDWSNRCLEKQENHDKSEMPKRIKSQEESVSDHPSMQIIHQQHHNDDGIEVFTEKPRLPMPMFSSAEAQNSETEDTTEKATEPNRHSNTFFAFGSDGIYVIDPTKMSMVKHIKASDLISGTQSTTCTGSPPKSCTWGGAVNVGNKKIYAADTFGRRLIVIDVESLQLVEAIKTEMHPYKPQYVHSLDEVWFTGLTEAVEILTDEYGDNGTINVISMATKNGPHKAMLIAKCNATYGLHVTDTCHTQDQERFGYVTHLDQPGFHEVSLQDKEVTQFFNLSSYGCHSTYGFALSVTTGHAIANCYTSKDSGQQSQLIVDLKAKELVAMATVNTGIPHISPDGRFVITLNGYTISAVYFNHDGAIEMGDVIKTNMLLSDVAFFPRDYGYDMYVTSKDTQSIVVVHADPSGMRTIDVLSDVGMPYKDKDLLHTERGIVIGCEGHAHYLASPATAENAVIIIDGHLLSVKGKLENVHNASVIVWVGGEDD